MAVDAQETLAQTTARVGTIKHGQMLIFQMWRAFEGHGTANMGVGMFNFILAEAKSRQHIKIEIIQLRIGEAQCIAAEIITKAEPVKRKFDIKGRFKRTRQFRQCCVIKAFVFEGIDADRLAFFQTAVTNRVTDDVIDLILAIAHVFKGFWNNTVDDLKVTATGKFLELHNRKVRLNTCGVTIHHQTNRACWRDHG